jgi:hypothetical protein
MAKTNVALSPHCAAILSALRSGPHTTRELQRSIGMTCPSVRIHELRVAGYPIETTMVRVNNRHGARCTVARYSLARRRRKTAAKRRA